MALELTLTKDRAVYAVGTLQKSWMLTIQRFFPLFLAWGLSLAGPVIMIIIGAIAGGIADKAATGHPGIYTLIGLLLPGTLIGWLWGGWNLVCLKVARGLEVRPSDMFRPPGQIASAFFVLILSTVCIGLLSPLVIPGALLFLKWQLAPFYIVDRGYGPLKALNASWKDTDRVFIPLALLDLAFWGLNIVSTFILIGPILCGLALGVASALVYNNWLTDESHPDLKTKELEVDG